MSKEADGEPRVSDSGERTLPSEKRQGEFAELKAGFDDPEMSYGPFMFWFWDAPLDASNPAEMARAMAAQNINPGYAHARHTMVDEPSLDPDEEWLSEEWFDAFEAGLLAAESAGTQLGYCDEYWWPSMRAAGRVVKERPDLEGTYLRWRTVDIPGGEVASVPDVKFAVVARLNEPLVDAEEPVVTLEDERHVPRTIRSESVRLVDPDETWTAPDNGDWRCYAFSEATHEETFSEDVQTMPSYVDERLADAFIEIALEPYDERFGERMGGSLPGDFIDNEGTYGKLLAWSESLRRRYEADHGRDIRRRMPLMLDEDSEGAYASARVNWFQTVSELYAENYEEVTDWHERRGAYTTGHFWEESLPAQARWVGDHLAMQRSLSMPGQDCLGDNAMSVHDFKEAQSVAEFEGVRFMTEFMGAGGATEWGQYNVTGEFSGDVWETFVPRHIKRFSNAIFAWGASHVIPHGVFTTRTLEGNPWPPDWYEVNPMFPQLHNWADFTRRASYVHSHGDQVADVLLVNPKETIWALSGFELFDETLEPDSLEERWSFPEERPSGERVNHVDEVYSEAMTELADARIEYLVTDSHYLRGMTADDGRLSRDNDDGFGAVVLPPLDVLPLETAELLVEFTEGGGIVYALGELPTGSTESGFDDPVMAALMERLRDQSTFTATDDVGSVIGERGLERHVEFVGSGFDLLQHHRRIDGREFVWLANDTPDKQTCELLIRDVTGAAERWDPETGDIDPVGTVVKDDDSHASLSFEGYEAYWLVFDPERDPVAPEDIPGSTTEPIETVEGPWTISYDSDAQPPLEHPVEPQSAFQGEGTTRKLGSWHSDWGLPDSFSGRLDYATTVTVDEAESELLLDLGEVCWAAEVRVNDERVGDTLWPPHRVDITGAITPGENEICVRVANLVNNNYGQIEDSGLFGPVRLLSVE